MRHAFSFAAADFSHTPARENMRRHVLRVGDGSSRFSVSSCCLETIYGMFWIVVYVNQVVQGTRVLRFLCVHFLKSLAATACLSNPGVPSLIVPRIQPIVKFDLVIWILFVDRFHCIFVCLITL